MYKAIVADVDGTTVQASRLARPSSRLIEVVRELQKKDMHFFLATGRARKYMTHIVSDLAMKVPCVVSGGSQVWHPVTDEILWEAKIPKKIVEEVLLLLRDFDVDVYLDGSDNTSSIETPIDLVNFSVPSDRYGIIVDRILPGMAESIVEKISVIPEVTALSVNGWEQKVVLDIVSAQGTKKHGILKLCDVLGLSPEEIIGVGDSNNDLPMFEVVGRSVAMGGSTPRVMAVCDEVTDTVQNDGLAMVIEKYFL